MAGRANPFMKIEVDKLTYNRIRAKFSGDYLFGHDLRKVLTDVSDAGKAKAIQRVPVKTGLTRSVITSEVDRGAMPTWTRVRLSGSPQRGDFRYPWALNASKRIAYRHRSGSRQGKKTYRWFHGAKPAMRNAMKKSLKWLAGRVESRWRQ